MAGLIKSLNITDAILSGFTVLLSSMSLHRWLQSTSPSPFPLPVAEDGYTSMSAANEEIVKVMNTQTRQKRGAYVHYEDETRAKLARYASENGNKAAEFVREYGEKREKEVSFKAP